MRGSLIKPVPFLLSLCSLCPLWLSPALAADPTYWEDIRPVLRKHCTACHSAKNLKEVDVSGGLALDSYEALRKGGKQPVLQAGQSDASLLMKLIVTPDEDKRMPLGALPLPPETVALLRRWIDAGAREGTKPESTSTTSVTTSRRGRKLDVSLLTNAVPPRGMFGDAAPSKLELILKVGPLAPVTAVAFSPEGKLLAVGCYGRVTVWELPDLRPVKVLTNLLGAVHDVRFSPDGRLLAVGGGQASARGDLRLYQVADWQLLAALGGHEDVVFGLAFDPAGRRLASASFDKTVRVWDLATNRPAQTLTGHSDFVYAVAFSPDGQWLATASKDRTVKLVEAGTGKSRFTFSLDQEVLAVAISPDGKHVVSSGLQTALYWWNPATGQRVRAQGGHGVAVHELCFSRDGQLVASAGADKTVRLWNGTSGAPVRTLSAGASVNAVGLSPDGKFVAGGSFDGFVRLWDATNGKHLATLLAFPPEGERLDWLALSPQGYTASSPGLPELGQWRMAGQTVPADVVWRALGQPAALARAVRGEALAAPDFTK
jgi:WD40 repeat protein